VQTELNDAHCACVVAPPYVAEITAKAPVYTAKTLLFNTSMKDFTEGGKVLAFLQTGKVGCTIAGVIGPT
jgi:hypothetical protein